MDNFLQLLSADNKLLKTEVCVQVSHYSTKSRISAKKEFPNQRGTNPVRQKKSPVTHAARAKDIDKACTNKWSWSWLDKKFDDVAFAGWCHKLEEAGKAYCSLCRVEIRYAGVPFLRDFADFKEK